VQDGELHKGFHYGDGNYKFGRKKKRGLSTTGSNYYGLPYSIYSATPNFKFKNGNRYIGIINN
jgi:hypothetical protein